MKKNKILNSQFPARSRLKRQLMAGRSTLNSEGFTLPELVVTFGMLAILFGFISINLLKARQNVSISTTVTQVVADLRSQQIRTMIGDTEGRSSGDSYGVHFDATRYVLFHGTTYNSSSTSNASVALDNSIQFASVGTDVIFSQLSGKIASASAIILQDSTNNAQKTIHINIYGVVTSVN